MSRTQSISDLALRLQQENESLQSLKKLFNQACKNEFGFDVKTIHEKLTRLQLLEKKKADKQTQAATQSEQQNVLIASNSIF